MIKVKVDLEMANLLLDISDDKLAILRVIKSHYSKNAWYERLVVGLLYELKYPSLIAKYKCELFSIVLECPDLDKPEIIFKNDHKIYAKLFDLTCVDHELELLESSKKKIKR